MSFNHPVLVYHKVDDKVEWGLTRVRPNAFRRQIKYLQEHDYKFVTISELKNASQSDKVVAISFDDAYQSAYTHAYPILKEINAPATIYVITDYVGKDNLWDLNVGNIIFQHISWEELQELSDNGWEIGSHTLSHRDLRKLEINDLKKEFILSKELLESKLNIVVKSTSFPFGKFGLRELETAKAIGYLNSAVFYPIFKHFKEEDELFVVKRLGVYLWDTKMFFKFKLSGGIAKLLEILKQNVLNLFSSITILAQGLRK